MCARVRRRRTCSSPTAGRALAVGADGGLQISTALGVLQDSTPVSYQEIDGARVPVDSRYVLRPRRGERPLLVRCRQYRTDHELIIDPGVKYTTFLGGNSAENAEGIEVDAAGNIFVAGTTQSPDFPTTVGAFRRTGAASNFADVFVTKLNAAGTALVYSTFVGGSNMEFGNGLAVDSAGNAYVTGTTKSTNFPTTGNAFDRSLNTPGNCPRCGIDNTDGFVFKLNAAGSALVYSTYLRWRRHRQPARDRRRRRPATRMSSARHSRPTSRPRRVHSAESRAAGADMFVTKLNPTGSALTYSTFLGGTAVDNGSTDHGRQQWQCVRRGVLELDRLPHHGGAFDTTANGAFDATLTKLNPAGSALVYSTYIGGK